MDNLKLTPNNLYEFVFFVNNTCILLKFYLLLYK